MDLRSIQGELVVNSNQVQLKKYDSFLRRAKISVYREALKIGELSWEECFNLIDEWVCGGRAKNKQKKKKEKNKTQVLKNYFLHVQNPIISSTALLNSATSGVRYATGLGIKSSYEESTGGLKDPLRPVLQ